MGTEAAATCMKDATHAGKGSLKNRGENMSMWRLYATTKFPDKARHIANTAHAQGLIVDAVQRHRKDGTLYEIYVSDASA
jgi:hypothetical protein